MLWILLLCPLVLGCALRPRQPVLLRRSAALPHPLFIPQDFATKHRLIRRDVTLGFRRLRYWKKLNIQPNVALVYDWSAGMQLRIMKTLSKGKYSLITKKEPLSLVEEVKITNKLHHPAVPAIRDVFQDPSAWYLVTERKPGYEGLDLVNMLIERRRRLDEIVLQRIALQLFQFLSFAHQNAIVHSDIKPENIVIDFKGPYGPHYPVVYVIDFGCARRLSSVKSGKEPMKCATPAYLAPEFVHYPDESDIEQLNAAVLKHRGYTLPQQSSSADMLPPTLVNLESDQLDNVFLPQNHPLQSVVHRLPDLYKVDTFATGATLFLLADLRPLYNVEGVGATVKHFHWLSSVSCHLQNLSKPKHSPKDDDNDFLPKSLSDNGKDFLRNLLTVDPAQRMSAQAALQHAWLKDVRLVPAQQS